MSTITHDNLRLFDTCAVGLSPEFFEDGMAFEIFWDPLESCNVLYCTLDGGYSWEESLNPNKHDSFGSCFGGLTSSGVIGVCVSEKFVEDATVAALLSDGAVLCSTSSGSTWRVVGRLSAEDAKVSDARLILQRCIREQADKDAFFSFCDARMLEVFS